MSCVQNRCNCPDPTVVSVPGAPGTDATPLPPGAVDPNGNVVAIYAGQTYYNTATGTFWVATATGNASWVKLIAASA